ncbi:MAG TPA: magnesium transporter [Bdellovibrionota bacterium]|nr:magnesium transporter [Bdellovibrionota bacterium]
MQISQLFLPEVMEAIENGDLESLRTVFEDLHPSDVAELLVHLSPDRIAAIVRILRAPKGIDVFEQLELATQAEVLKHLGRAETVKLLEEMSADDRVDLLKKLPSETVDSLLPLMAQADRDDVRRLLQYGEKTAGALMTTEYASLPAQVTVAEAMAKLRNIAPDRETIYYIYIIDGDRKLLGTISLRDLVLARPTQKIEDFMSVDPISVRVDMDQEEVAKMVAKYDFLALPVIDPDKRLVGIITHDDAMDVVEREQTEDVQKLGGMEVLDAPYFNVGFFSLVRKRAGWLTALFLGEMFTATAMGYYEHEIERAVVLALFIPLIISSGGNSGSQASTLIIRALAVREVRLRDWWKVFGREIVSGLALGAILGTIGFFRIVLWQQWRPMYGEHYLFVAATVACSLLGVVMWGTITGSMLPFILRKLGFDPASASAPFVATLVDVTGLVIYFSFASLILGGVVL